MRKIVLEADEHILLRTRKHWIVFLHDAGATLAVGASFFVLLGVVTLPNAFDTSDPVFLKLFAFAEVVWVLLVWIALSALWTNYYLDIWIVTDRRIINVNQIGLFHRALTTWQFKNIQEITTESKNIVQNFFNYGLINIRTASPTEKHAYMEGIPSPDDVVALILKQIEPLRKLQETAKNQESLLHTVSHEVKAHLTKNEAAFAAIAEGDYGDIPERLKTMVRNALSETRTGVGMVMDILASSDFKTGATKFNMKPFDFSVVVRGVFSELKPDAEQKGLSAECTIQKDAPSFTVYGDERKLRDHVIRNLMDNAIHYTREGSVHVGVAHVEGAVLFIVNDTGIGIPPEEMERLFTEGGKGVHASDVNPASTGYGLFIAKQIVEAHGGAIWAESEGENLGSTFYVALPVADGSSPSRGAV